MNTLIIDTTPPQEYPIAEQDGVTISGNGETASQTVCLDNGRGGITARFSQPPLAVSARIIANGEIVFSGRIRAITLGASVRVELEP